MNSELIQLESSFGHKDARFGGFIPNLKDVVFVTVGDDDLTMIVQWCV